MMGAIEGRNSEIYPIGSGTFRSNKQSEVIKDEGAYQVLLSEEAKNFSKIRTELQSKESDGLNSPETAAGSPLL